MLQKLVGFIFVTLLAVNANASAMTLSQPILLGEILNTPFGGFVFRGESSNIGKLDIGNKFNNKFKNRIEKVYKSGIATFGNGINALYVHYDDDKEINIMFGNRDEKNTFTLYDGHISETGYVVNKIETDNGLVLYVLNRGGGNWGNADCSIIGRREDGIFVKYFDMFDIRKKYFENPRYVDFNKIYTRADSIIINFKYFYPKKEKEGEFRFKWDDNAQWFGIEQVVY